MTAVLPPLSDLYARLETERRFSKDAEIPLMEWVQRLGVNHTTYSSWKTVGGTKSVTASSFAKILAARLARAAPGADDDSDHGLRDRQWLAEGLEPADWYCRAALRDAALPYPLYDRADLKARRATPGGLPSLSELGDYIAAYAVFTLPRLLWQALDMISKWLITSVMTSGPVIGIDDIPVHRHLFVQDPAAHLLVHLPREVLQSLARQAGVAGTAPWCGDLWAEFDFLRSSLAHPSQRMGQATGPVFDGINGDLDLLLGHAKFAQSELPKLSTQVGPHYEWVLSTLAEDVRRRAEPPQAVPRTGVYTGESPIPWAQARPLLKKMYKIREAVGMLHARQVSLQSDVLRAIAALGADTFGITALRSNMQRIRLSEQEEPSDSAIQKVLDHFCTLAGPGTTAASRAEWEWQLERVEGGYRMLNSTASEPAPG